MRGLQDEEVEEVERVNGGEVVVNTEFISETLKICIFVIKRCREKHHRRKVS